MSMMAFSSICLEWFLSRTKSYLRRCATPDNFMLGILYFLKSKPSSECELPSPTSLYGSDISGA